MPDPVGRYYLRQGDPHIAVIDPDTGEIFDSIPIDSFTVKNRPINRSELYVLAQALNLSKEDQIKLGLDPHFAPAPPPPIMEHWRNTRRRSEKDWRREQSDRSKPTRTPPFTPFEGNYGPACFHRSYLLSMDCAYHKKQGLEYDPRARHEPNSTVPSLTVEKADDNGGQDAPF